jgi:hypothetical protein
MTCSVITTPGKFEGQRPIIVNAYNRWLDGLADDDGDIITVELPVAWREGTRVPIAWETIRFTIDSLGFVCEVTP